MSKVKIQGNASGTGVVTLTAPNTNTDRTITLPDGDITLGGGVDGIVSTANATAITIDSNEKVGIGTGSPDTILHIDGAEPEVRIQDSNDNGEGKLSFVNNSGTECASIRGFMGSQQMVFNTNNTERMRITSDGRGLSQFTAKAWVNFNGTGTVAIRDSHNVSSITDNGTGRFTVNMTNALANVNYAVTGSCASASHTSNVFAIGSAGHNPSFSTASFRGVTLNDGGSYLDKTYVHITVFGD